MKPKKLKYDERTETFRVFGEANEGAMRETIGTATEEWVISAIINQEMIKYANDKFGRYLEQIKENNKEGYEKLQKEIISNFEKRCDMIHKQLNAIVMKKRWWQFWKKQKI